MSGQSGPKVRRRLWTPRSKTSQSWRDRFARLPRAPFVLLIVICFFKVLTTSIGHLASFMCSTAQPRRLFLLQTSGSWAEQGSRGQHVSTVLYTIEGFFPSKRGFFNAIMAIQTGARTWTRTRGSWKMQSEGTTQNSWKQVLLMLTPLVVHVCMRVACGYFKPSLNLSVSQPFSFSRHIRTTRCRSPATDFYFMTLSFSLSLAHSRITLSSTSCSETPLNLCCFVGSSQDKESSDTL